MAFPCSFPFSVASEGTGAEGVSSGRGLKQGLGVRGRVAVIIKRASRDAAGDAAGVSLSWPSLGSKGCNGIIIVEGVSVMSVALKAFRIPTCLFDITPAVVESIGWTSEYLTAGH
jgi:hypothetical protein